MTDKFKPKPIIRNPIFQTIFSSLRIRKDKGSPMSDCAEELILDGDKGEKLLAYHSKNHGTSKGTVLLIHGWEGSSDSSYILNTGKFLFNNGFDIIRLNLRDHGNSHHLNKGIFKSTLLDETFGVVRKAAMLDRAKPFYMIGFSLGGNFILRMAIKAGKEKIKNLKHAAAISPLLDPGKSMSAADRTFIIKKYFIKKWIRSLLKKQALYPDLYDFSDIHGYKTLCRMMEVFVPKYTEFNSVAEYYRNYSIPASAFNNIKIPVTIITSKDDPIIPVEDFYKISPNRKLNLLIQPYGGHSGFFDLFPYSVWYEHKLLEIFSE